MLYKLTDQNMQTYGGFQWELGVTYALPEKQEPELCSTGVFHVYENLNLAFLLNPIHAGFVNPRVFSANGEIVVSDWGKAGVFELTLAKELDVPSWVGSDIDTDVRIMFGILCAESVLHIYENGYESDVPRKAIAAARNYLNTKTAADAADAAAAAARTAAYAAAADAAAAAAYAARAAAAADLVIDFGELADKAVSEIVL